eukprot:TRINITY_DN84501_c0_g1_i1.p1 TRINITY_DN84501_c0_g1~~TRINITY_DN84501_c0_g1_i1.p1  ORF type:complete len:152 (-),score=3.92 TRINITY_DN84501_c0_g1_i1:36-491(-)
MAEAAEDNPSQPLITDDGAAKSPVDWLYVLIGVVVCALVWPFAVLMIPAVVCIYGLKRVYFEPDADGVTRGKTNFTELVVAATVLLLIYTAYYFLWHKVLYPSFCPSDGNLPCKLTSYITWIFNVIGYLQCRMSGDGGRNTNEYCQKFHPC